MALLGGFLDEVLRPGHGWFALLGLLPLVCAAAVLGRRRAMLARLAEPRHLERLFPDLARRAGAGKDLGAWLARRGWLRAVLSAAAAALLALALLGPVRGFALVPVATRQIDVVVCLDTSRSMLVEDVEPSRLARAKNEVAALFDAMRGERVGLVAFAGLARMVAPLTKDV
ncbi:MAG: VWA domain-containing protein, partial [Planctomycetota bacterium]|nr:VWA domain-containing protein [Planctomycetota bacterium]